MRRNRLDEQTIERLLRGELGADDLPPAYGPVAGLLGAAATVTPIDEGHEAGTVAAMRAAVLGHPVPVPTTGGSRPMLSKLLSAKAAGIAVVAVLGAGTAAAATGSLPGPAQNAAAHALSHIDISLPTTPPSSPGKSAASHSDENTDASGSTSGATTDTDAGKGPNANADFGLCNAESHNDGHPNANADVFPPTTTCTTVTQPVNGSSTTKTSEPSETTEPDHGSGQGTGDESTSSTTSSTTTTSGGSHGSSGTDNSGSSHPTGDSSGTPGGTRS